MCVVSHVALGTMGQLVLCLMCGGCLRSRLSTAYCRLPTAHCLPPTAHCRLPTAYCRLPSTSTTGPLRAGGSTNARSRPITNPPTCAHQATPPPVADWMASIW